MNPHCSYYSEGEGLEYETALIQNEAEVSANWKELRRRKSRLRGGSVWFNSQLAAVQRVRVCVGAALVCVCVCVHVILSDKEKETPASLVVLTFIHKKKQPKKHMMCRFLFFTTMEIMIIILAYTVCPHSVMLLF